MPEETIPRCTPQRREGSGGLCESLPMRPMIRRVPRSQCLGRTRAGQRYCHDASSVRRYPASARAVLAAESGLPGNLRTEARRIRTEARRGDRHRGARRGAPGVVHLSEVRGHGRVVELAAFEPAGPGRSERSDARLRRHGRRRGYGGVRDHPRVWPAGCCALAPAQRRVSRRHARGTANPADPAGRSGDTCGHCDPGCGARGAEPVESRIVGAGACR